MGLFGNNVEGSGRVITEPRPVPEFHAVELTTIGTLILAQGEHEQLVVEGEDNILAAIKSEVADGRLTISNREQNTRLHPTQPLVYRLTVKTVTEISLSGSGRIEAGALTLGQLAARISGSGDVVIAQLTTRGLTIHTNGSGALAVHQMTTRTLEVHSSGSGSVTLAGQATQQTISLSGSGRYAAADLGSQDAQVRISGSGSATVRVAATLDVHISGSGSVHYLGQPTVTQQRSGSGGVYPQAAG